MRTRILTPFEKNILIKYIKKENVSNSIYALLSRINRDFVELKAELTLCELAIETKKKYSTEIDKSIDSLKINEKGKIKMKEEYRKIYDIYKDK